MRPTLTLEPAPARAPAPSGRVGSTLAVIVPVHNEEANIWPFYERARSVLNSMGGADWEMVFVNNGSTDGTFAKIRDVRTKDKRVKVISLSRDFGYQAVVLAGLSLVTADRYAMIDVDCEDPPELLREFHLAIEGGADIAYGIRSNRVEPFFVTFFRRLFYYVNKSIADSDIVLWMAEFSMITRQVRDAIIAPRTTYVFLRAEIAYVGFSRVGVPYVRQARAKGTSHYNLWSMTRFAVAGFLASSTFPLRLVLYVATAAGALYFLVVVIGGLNATAAANLASIATFYFTLLALSTIALYLARTYKNGVARPVFIVDKNKTEL